MLDDGCECVYLVPDPTPADVLSRLANQLTECTAHACREPLFLLGDGQKEEETAWWAMMAGALLVFLGVVSARRRWTKSNV